MNTVAYSVRRIMMNKTLKKLIAFVLVFALSLSVFAGVFAVFAEDATVAEGTTVVEEIEEEEYSTTTFFDLFVRFWKSIGDFLKYIFYDVFLGKPAPEIPPVPNNRYF